MKLGVMGFWWVCFCACIFLLGSVLESVSDAIDEIGGNCSFGVIV